MPRYSDEQYKRASALLKERESLIADSGVIDELTKLREATRTRARRLKSAAIAHEIGVTQSWVEQISEKRIVRGNL
jgi:predicted kinase